MPAAAEDFSNVAVVDVMCADKAKAEPDKHTRDCALQCQGSGYAIVTDKGEVIKLDDTGNQQLIAALKQSTKRDNLRVNVSGERKGDKLQVKKLSMA